MHASDVLRYGHLTFLGTLDGLPEELAERPGACGVWSVRDIVAHLASYELVLVDVLRGLVEPGVAAPMLDRFLTQGAAFNDTEVDARRGVSLAEALAELNAAHARTLELAGGLPAGRACEAGALPWYGAEYDLDDLIAYQYYGHKREHGAQVAAFRDLPAHRALERVC